MILPILLAATAINGCQVVDGDHIFLRDIAAVDSRFAMAQGSVLAGYSPQPMATRVFWPIELRHLAEQNGIISDQPYRQICFERRTHLLTEEEVKAAAHSWLPAGSAIEVVQISRFPVPSGELSIPKPTTTQTGMDGTILLRGYVSYSGTQSLPTWAKVKIKIQRKVFIASSDLRAGQPILPEVVKVEELEGGIEAVQYASELDQLNGRVVNRAIRAGSPILVSSLEAAKQVARGAIVKVEVRSGGARLTLEGQAEAGGWVGDLISVRNPSSGKAFRARITGENAVEVTPFGGSLIGSDRK